MDGLADEEEESDVEDKEIIPPPSRGKGGRPPGKRHAGQRAARRAGVADQLRRELVLADMEELRPRGAQAVLDAGMQHATLYCLLQTVSDVKWLDMAVVEAARRSGRSTDAVRKLWDHWCAHREVWVSSATRGLPSAAAAPSLRGDGCKPAEGDWIKARCSQLQQAGVGVSSTTLRDEFNHKFRPAVLLDGTIFFFFLVPNDLTLTLSTWLP